MGDGKDRAWAALAPPEKGSWRLMVVQLAAQEAFNSRADDEQGDASQVEPMGCPGNRNLQGANVGNTPDGKGAACGKKGGGDGDFFSKERCSRRIVTGFPCMDAGHGGRNQRDRSGNEDDVCCKLEAFGKDNKMQRLKKNATPNKDNGKWVRITCQ